METNHMRLKFHSHYLYQNEEPYVADIPLYQHMAFEIIVLDWKRKQEMHILYGFSALAW